MEPLILFGASGDLARAKVLPAILRLRRDGAFAPGRPLVFAARRPIDPRELLAAAAAERAPDAAEALASLAADARAIELPLGDVDAARRAARELPPDAAAYAALPPSTLPALVATADALRSAGRLARLAVEKPLGRGRREAESIVAAARGALGDGFALVDHYAWKPAVRGLAALAAAGESGVPSSGVTSVDLAMRESLRVGRRAAFYDEVGATRDVFQSHGLLLLGRALSAATGATFADALASVSVEAAEFARYNGYEAEGGVDPQTETSARVRMRSSLLPDAEIAATYGKALPQSGVHVTVAAGAGDWRLDVQPDSAVRLPDGGRRAFAAEGAGYDAYEGALGAVLSGDFSAAPSPEDVAHAWRIVEEARELALARGLVRHEPGEDPSW